jgi:hypothetical protein
MDILIMSGNNRITNMSNIHTCTIGSVHLVSAMVAFMGMQPF